MSEYLREVTGLLNYKNIVPTVELPEIPVSDADPITRMSLLLPKPQLADNKEPIKVVRLPFEYDNDLPKINPTSLRVNVVSADGRVLGFKPSEDDIFEPTDESVFRRDLFIPNGEEQISFRAAVEDNADKLMHDRLGLSPDEYGYASDFKLFASYLKSQGNYRIKNDFHSRPIKRRRFFVDGIEVFDKITVSVDIKTKLGHKAIIDRLKSDRFESDLSPEDVVVLNSQEIIDAQKAKESEIREMGHFGLFAGVDIIMSALKKM